MTIAVLSWGAHKTLTQSLESYREFGLDQLDDEKIIYFQQISQEDIDIAHRFGYKWIGSMDNVGIAEGYKRLVEEATGEFFLFLENDWLLLEDAKESIIDGQFILKQREANVIRYRHRRFPGHPLWTSQFEGTEEDHPTHLLDSVHWTETPENFKGISKGFLGYYYAKATHANWTNNPTMIKTNFIKKYILPRITGDIEHSLQEWWEQQNWIYVAQGEGLFTHSRLD